jgi:2,4-dienoyl-CoA reductase-like NADH-dependent reductase (Old Yellow Enzyme family)
MLFQPFTINNITFKNRILRSSIGGRMANYDGTVSPAWTAFEKRFAASGVGGIISATISINRQRMSPLEYPSLHSDTFVPALRAAVGEIKRAHPDCPYLIQLGDTGGHTHTSLIAQAEDALSSSGHVDLIFGYRNRAVAMSEVQIAQSIEEFGAAAARVREAGCDGVEITASKGYLVHQFLNPGINRRTDAFGGSVQNRFRFLAEVVQSVRRRVGSDFLFGVRISAKDFNYLPVNLRLPITFPLRHYFIGNDLPETTYYARQLELLGVDYLHVDSGYGFPNPKGSPGAYPDSGFKVFVNANRHLSLKAELRAVLFNVVPGFLRRRIFGAGWRFVPAANVDYAAAIKQAVRIPVISNGGFQNRDAIEATLRDGKSDLVAMARPLLANIDLIDRFRAGQVEPERPCSFCTLCCARTAVFPLGCYDVSRFPSPEAMMAQVLSWSSPDLVKSAP